MSNKERFRQVYTAALAHCVVARPDWYAWGPDATVESVAGRMLAAIEAGTFNHDSPAFRRAAKELGIKPTRTAILAFWNAKDPS